MAGPPAPGRMWEDLRKEARKLEGEVDSKLAAYSKAGAGIGGGLAGLEHGVDDREAEMERLLQRLSAVHGAMGKRVGPGDARSHTLARHRDILTEYSQEFRRLQVMYGAASDRAALLRGADDSPLLGAQAQGGANALLRERGSIQSASTALDQVMGQAQAVASNLSSQKRLFGNMGTKLATVGAQFPVVNSLLTSIRRRKSKDTIVLTSVIFVCTILLLFYWARK